MLQLKVFSFNPLQVNACLIYDQEGYGVLIDPACMNETEYRRLDDFIAGNGIHIDYLLLTHAHFDHVFGARYIHEKYRPSFRVHADDRHFLEYAAEQAGTFGFGFNGPVPEPDGFLADGQVITAGSIRLEVRHVPGHSRGSVSFYEPAIGWLFSGDTLFAGGIGRTDLPGGNYEQILESIRTRLLTLPGETIVYPGHGPFTTIRAENLSNPFLV